MTELYEQAQAIIAVVLSITLVLMVVTNIIVQTLKESTQNKIPTNILALVIAMIITPLTVVAYCQITGVALTWYILVGSLVLGFFVAYAAMFGYDKLVETMTQISRIQKNKAKEDDK